MVPTVELPPAIPLTLHDRLVAEPPATVAVNICEPPVGTFADGGETEMAILLVRFTVAEPLTCEFDCRTAVTVTPGKDGSVVGAVYRPPAEMVPTVALPPAAPFTCHVTAPLAPVRTAWNCCIAPSARVALGGTMLMADPPPEPPPDPPEPAVDPQSVCESSTAQRITAEKML